MRAVLAGAVFAGAGGTGVGAVSAGAGGALVVVAIVLAVRVTVVDVVDVIEVDHGLVTAVRAVGVLVGLGGDVFSGRGHVSPPGCVSSRRPGCGRRADRRCCTKLPAPACG